jgi:hypothetical protein
MSNGHTVFTNEDSTGVASEDKSINVALLVFQLTGDTLNVRVDLRRGRFDGLVYLTAVEAMKIAKELRRLAIAAFEAS